MARNASYSGTVDLIAGLRPKNGGSFPLMDAADVQTREDGTRLDSELEQLWAAIGEIMALIENGGTSQEAIAILDNAILDMTTLA